MQMIGQWTRPLTNHAYVQSNSETWPEDFSMSDFLIHYRNAASVAENKPKSCST
jgi:hypothetical protein